ncbi:MAG: hypothetical protein H6R10_345 [Rhodocyclaceae bacterium]|nr:hypothetical protein [Rhodocyclaceae bacterium]
MRIPWTTAIAAALLVAGCATPAEQAARAEREMDRLMVVYGPACEKLGFQRDTNLWRDCILRLAQKESYERAYMYPLTTSCFGPPGFVQCTTY